uniref:Uncharacterized protein n=1 Tax=Chromera velia CCMP2878 TaxID=1169474 RepID=A0A0G4GXQ8_9ALVE|eukprot:Cvel_23828.t1-p1 / transcript=Cvel_23828.t1 / gene=Cvel_23828 / organism=Chromera_velia_CCMP2878 / gene_product=hypothetical protein / transcript_product=hypothetical protein / location=Cvel_scaffold2505:908-2978(+) / protein_length=514 / sequence_SO=supercontig / SO=protein_coding / is_pseudo=false
MRSIQFGLLLLLLLCLSLPTSGSLISIWHKVEHGVSSGWHWTEHHWKTVACMGDPGCMAGQTLQCMHADHEYDGEIDQVSAEVAAVKKDMETITTQLKEATTMSAYSEVCENAVTFEWTISGVEKEARTSVVDRICHQQMDAPFFDGESYCRFAFNTGHQYSQRAKQRHSEPTPSHAQAEEYCRQRMTKYLKSDPAVVPDDQPELKGFHDKVLEKKEEVLSMFCSSVASADLQDLKINQETEMDMCTKSMSSLEPFWTLDRCADAWDTGINCVSDWSHEPEKGCTSACSSKVKDLKNDVIEDSTPYLDALQKAMTGLKDQRLPSLKSKLQDLKNKVNHDCAILDDMMDMVLSAEKWIMEHLCLIIDESLMVATKAAASVLEGGFSEAEEAAKEGAEEEGESDFSSLVCATKAAEKTEEIAAKTAASLTSAICGVISSVDSSACHTIEKVARTIVDTFFKAACNAAGGDPGAAIWDIVEPWVMCGINIGGTNCGTALDIDNCPYHRRRTLLSRKN